MEVMAREHDDFVWILWQKNTTIWVYDRTVLTYIPYYYASCWPIRQMPTHVCCANKFLRRIIKPVINATLNRDGRSRTLIHDVPESEILSVLAEYGILNHMLPTYMGGTVDLDPWLSTWVDHRRAIEMEEI